MLFLFSEFENLAIGVLDECYGEDEVLAEMLVEREIPKWGGMCALNLAAAAHGEKFLAHPCCQSSLNSIWKSRGMPRVPYWKVCCKYHTCWRDWLASVETISPHKYRGSKDHLRLFFHICMAVYQSERSSRLHWLQKNFGRCNFEHFLLSISFQTNFRQLLRHCDEI